MNSSYRVVAAILLLGWSMPSSGAQKPPMDSDIPPKYTLPKTGFDYVKRVEMVPMRDGVKLYTIIVSSQGRGARTDPADAHAVQRREPRGPN